MNAPVHKLRRYQQAIGSVLSAVWFAFGHCCPLVPWHDRKWALQSGAVAGAGRHGAVYLVEDQNVFGKQWALKELLGTFTNPADRAQAVRQFEAVHVRMST